MTKDTEDSSKPRGEQPGRCRGALKSIAIFLTGIQHHVHRELILNTAGIETISGRELSFQRRMSRRPSSSPGPDAERLQVLILQTHEELAGVVVSGGRLLIAKASSARSLASSPFLLDLSSCADSLSFLIISINLCAASLRCLASFSHASPFSFAA